MRSDLFGRIVLIMLILTALSWMVPIALRVRQMPGVWGCAAVLLTFATAWACLLWLIVEMFR